MSRYDTVAKLDTYPLDFHKFNVGSCLYPKFICAGWIFLNIQQQKYDPSLIDINDDEKVNVKMLMLYSSIFLANQDVHGKCKLNSVKICDCILLISRLLVETMENWKVRKGINDLSNACFAIQKQDPPKVISSKWYKIWSNSHYNKKDFSPHLIPAFKTNPVYSPCLERSAKKIKAVYVSPSVLGKLSRKHSTRQTSRKHYQTNNSFVLRS